MGAREKRDYDIREISSTWHKIILRRRDILYRLRELFNKEQERVGIVRRMQSGDKLAKSEQDVKRIKQLAEEERTAMKRIEHRLEQCRLLIRHQQKKAEEFLKNL